MNNLKHYTPDDIPKEIQTYESKVNQLGVGKTGKVGIIDLELQADDTGKTVITKQFSQVPLQIQRAVYPENLLPKMMYLYIISPSGGILQGDRYRTDILLKNKSICHITTQGATRIYSMNSNSASQILNIIVKENCYLEYIPDQIIPYKNSRYYQKVNLNVHNNSTLIYSEILTPGRVAMGESFEYDICYLRTHCRNQDKKIRFLENTKIEPKKQKLNNFGILGDYNVVGTIYIFTRNEIVIELEKKINQDIKKADDSIFVGTSILPDKSGVIIRILDNKTDSVLNLVLKIVEICRKKILNTGFSKIRKN
ncbi:MAG: urease accessory protein UreD [Nitrosopumilus sp.]|nr:urease accessory protein UreD [Nitrosopumilus sp.]